MYLFFLSIILSGLLICTNDQKPLLVLSFEHSQIPSLFRIQSVSQLGPSANHLLYIIITISTLCKYDIHVTTYQTPTLHKIKCTTLINNNPIILIYIKFDSKTIFTKIKEQLEIYKQSSDLQEETSFESLFELLRKEKSHIKIESMETTISVKEKVVRETTSTLYFASCRTKNPEDFPLVGYLSLKIMMAQHLKGIGTCVSNLGGEFNGLSTVKDGEYYIDWTSENKETVLELKNGFKKLIEEMGDWEESNNMGDSNDELNTEMENTEKSDKFNWGKLCIFGGLIIGVVFLIGGGIYIYLKFMKKEKIRILSKKHEKLKIV